MATEETVKELHIIELSASETVNMIGLLAAQLAGVALQGNTNGAAASVNIMNRGTLKYRIVFTVKRTEDNNV